MDQKQIGALIEAGEAVFGLELGSTRIKAVLIGENGAPLASGSFDWENRLENGVWTYRLEDVWHGIQESYKNLAAAVREKYGVELKRLKGLGFSAMMHGYLAFDRGGALLVPFRTWRNTMTEAAAADLTRRFGFNIPQRWSILSSCRARRAAREGHRVYYDARGLRPLEADGRARARRR